jgi:hypothetical protein
MTDDPITLYCVNHPQTATALRCNRCEKPICIKCAVLTPTGYRCKDCVRGQQKVFDTSLWYDYPLAFGVAAVISGLGSLIAPLMSFLTIFIAPIVGVVIAEAVRVVTRRRRSRLLAQIATVAAALGSLPLVAARFLDILAIYQAGLGSIYGVNIFLTLLWPGVYMILVTASVYYRVAGIEIRRY